MSDQPVLQAVVQDPMMSDQPMAPPQQPSYHQQSPNIAQLGQFRYNYTYINIGQEVSVHNHINNT